MKRFIIGPVVSAVVVILLVTGCGQKEPGPSAAKPPGERAAGPEASPASPPVKQAPGSGDTAKQETKQGTPDGSQRVDTGKKGLSDKEVKEVPVTPGDNVSQAPEPGTAAKTSESPQAKPQEKSQLSAEEARKKYVRTAQSAGVSIEATWLTPEYAASTGAESKVAGKDTMVIVLDMTTHSGDLLSFDLGQNSTLSAKGREAKPARWEWTTRDAHHPVATLWFDVPAPSSGLKLTISNLRGANPVFSW